MSNYKVHVQPIQVRTIDKKKQVTLESVGDGQLLLLFMYKTSKTILTLKGVQSVPTANQNIISANRFNMQFKASCMLNCKSGYLTYR